MLVVAGHGEQGDEFSVAPPLPTSDAPPVREGEVALAARIRRPPLHLGAASTSEGDERGDGHDEGGR
jgi:hypothetical protein